MRETWNALAICPLSAVKTACLGIKTRVRPSGLYAAAMDLEEETVFGKQELEKCRMHLMMSIMGHPRVLNAVLGYLCYCSKSSTQVGDGWLHNEGNWTVKL